jgi:hypothetical protein
MLEAFRNYERHRDRVLVDHSVIGVPLGSRLRRIIRLANGWKLWMSTSDFVYGTYLVMNDNGMIRRITIREDEGPEVMVIRPTDEDIIKS